MNIFLGPHRTQTKKFLFPLVSGKKVPPKNIRSPSEVNSGRSLNRDGMQLSSKSPPSSIPQNIQCLPETIDNQIYHGTGNHKIIGIYMIFVYLYGNPDNRSIRIFFRIIGFNMCPWIIAMCILYTFWNENESDCPVDEIAGTLSMYWWGAYQYIVITTCIQIKSLTGFTQIYE